MGCEKSVERSLRPVGHVDAFLPLSRGPDWTDTISEEEKAAQQLPTTQARESTLDSREREQGGKETQADCFDKASVRSLRGPLELEVLNGIDSGRPIID